MHTDIRESFERENLIYFIIISIYLQFYDPIMLISFLSLIFFTLSPRRSSFQISVDVLRVINQGESKPTRIMYASNLSWNTLKKTLELLLKKDYIEDIQGSGSNKTYSITTQGINILKFCDQIEELVNLET